MPSCSQWSFLFFFSFLISSISRISSRADFREDSDSYLESGKSLFLKTGKTRSLKINQALDLFKNNKIKFLPLDFRSCLSRSLSLSLLGLLLLLLFFGLSSLSLSSSSSGSSFFTPPDLTFELNTFPIRLLQGLFRSWKFLPYSEKDEVFYGKW